MNWYDTFHAREFVVTGLDTSTNYSEITNRNGLIYFNVYNIIFCTVI
jgi:hypothetical protein